MRLFRLWLWFTSLVSVHPFEFALCLVVSWCWVGHAVGLSMEPPDSERRVQAAIERARKYLTAKEAAWRRDHGCISCHNQGLALRAVWLVDPHPGRLSADEPVGRWIVQPALWQVEERLGEGDQSMAELLFARAALTAHQRGMVALPPQTLEQIARRVASHFQTDQRWPSDPTSPLTSPLSPGAILGSHLACRVLSGCAPEAYGELVSRCRRQLFIHLPRNVPEAGAQLWAISGNWRQYQRSWRQAWTLIQQSQSSRGGWGPYANTPPEPFDTAIAVIGLCEVHRHSCPDLQQIAVAIRKGRDFLLEPQRDDGGWDATTRPPGRDSYAQHIATTAWVLEALYRCRKR